MLLERAELWSPRDGRVFREPPWHGLVGVVFLGGIGAAAWAAAFFGPLGPLRWFGWLAGVPFLGIAAVLGRGALRGLGPANWVLIARETGLAVKVRSFWNADLPSRDPVVAWIPREEIRALRRVERARPVPVGDGRDNAAGTERQAVRALDVLLTHERTEELAAACRRERSFRGEGRTHFHRYPVSVPAPGCVRVTWRDASARLSPSLDRALAFLARTFPVEEPLEIEGRDWRELEGEELDDLILELVQSGQEIRALHLVRLRYRMSLAEAKAFLGELTGRAA